jgi:O-antigen/teichoic acid export membrane protein
MNDLTDFPEPEHQPPHRALTADASHAARSGAVQVLTILGQAILPLSQVFVARLFGTTVFGAYQGSAALVEIFTRGGTGGADKAMLRYVAAHRANADESAVLRTLGTGLRQCLVVSGILASLLFFGAPVIAKWLREPALSTSLPAMAPAVMCTGLMYVLVQASLGAKITRTNFIVRGLGEPSLLLLAGLGAALFGRGLDALAIAYSIAAACTLGLAIFFVGKVFGHGSLLRALRAPRLGGFAGFSMPIGASELINSILQRADILLLTAFAGVRAAGIYAAAEFLGRAVANIRYAFDSIAASVLSEAWHLGERERLRYNLALMTRWVTSVAAPLAALAIALRSDLLGLYGQAFVAGSTAMIILAVAHLVNASLGLTPWLLMVGGRSRLMLFDNAFCAGLNIVLGLLLIPRLQIVGTALAVLTTITVLQLLILWQTWRAERVHPFELRLTKPLLAAGAMLGMQALASHHLGGIVRIAVVLLGGLVFYVIVLVALGLPEEERHLLRKLGARIQSIRDPA